MFLTEIEWLLTELLRLRADVLAPVSLVVAVAVTIHVLLHKREVGSAIGWIGLAWLAPILGGGFYAVFGINRVRRRAQRLGRGRGRPAGSAVPDADISHHLAPLAVACRRITGRPATAGNALGLLHNGDEAYPPMLAAIAAAQHSIALSSYILRDDAGGGPFIDALIAAHRRGVAVRVLIDGIGSGYFYSASYRRLRRHQVPVARFLHSLLPWRMPFLNLRTHKKLLVVDGRLAFTGGMNIAAENLLRGHPAHPVRDTHFQVSGPVVAQLTAAFVEDWFFVTGEELGGDPWFPPLAAAGPGVARVVTSGPDQDLEKIEYVALSAIACARRTVHVVTPYFLPDERLVTALNLAAMRGVRVDVIMPGRSNRRIVDWAARANAAPLLDEGCRIWLSRPPFDHSKIMVVDGEWCLIGSSNWDMRSFRLNFELTVEVYHDGLAAVLEAMVAERMHHLLTAAELTARPLPVRLRDAAMRLMLPYL